MTADVLNLTNVRRSKSYATGIAAAENAPDPLTSTRILIGELTDIVRLSIAYTGSVTECSVRLWLYEGGNWYRGTSTNENDPLTGTAPGEVRDFYGVASSLIGFQVEALVGGGSVDLDVKVIRFGSAAFITELTTGLVVEPI